MASQTLTQLHQSTGSLAGAWKLVGGRAITLQPREPGLLRIAHGSVWATCDGPHTGALNDQGDQFLRAGEKLQLRRGQRVVVEACDKHLPAYFSWDPLPRPAVVLGASAAGRLLAALAGFGWARVGRERPSLADRAFNAHSSACRAHGAMS